MPQGLFDKPKDKTPWIDPRFKQDQESTTPRLDQAISAIGGFMGLPQEGNIGSPNTIASQYGGLASAALPFLGASSAALSGMRGVNTGAKPAIAGRGIVPTPMGKGISPSMLPPDLIPMGAEAAFNAPKITQPAELAINYGARTNPSIGGRIDVVKMMNDLGSSRNAAKLQRGEMSTR